MTKSSLSSVKLWLAVALSFTCGIASSNEENSRSPSHRQTSPEQAVTIAKAQGIATAVVAYRNVDLFAGTSEDSIAQGVTIVVAGDRIAAVVNSADDSEAIPEQAEIVDGTGWYVIPGLIDSHVHLSTLPNRKVAEARAKRYLFGGITMVRDMAGDARSLADLSRSSLINEIVAPDIKYSAVMAGSSFFSDPRTIMAGLGTQPGQVPWLQGIAEDTDLSLAVAKANGTWATGIKIYANLPGDIVRNIVIEARQQEMPVWAHVEVYPATIYDSIGADAVSHACMIPEALMRPEGAKPRTPEANVDLSNFDVSSAAFRRYVVEMKASGTAMDATAHLYRKAVAAAAESEDDAKVTSARPLCPFESVVGPILSALHAAGVPIVAGTDFNSAADDPWPALLEEMETLADVEAMSNADVIRAATTNAADMLHLGSELGTIETGKYANLVFLQDDPLDSIGNLRSLVLTVKRGHQFYRADYVHQQDALNAGEGTDGSP